MRQRLRIVDKGFDRKPIRAERLPPGSLERREHHDEIDIRKDGAFAAHDGAGDIGECSSGIAAGDAVAGDGQRPLRKNMFLDIVHDLVLEYGAQAGTKNPLVSGGLVSAAMNGIQFTRLPPTAARWW